MKLLFLCVWILISASGLAMAGQYENGVADIPKGNVSEAVKFWRQAAEQGDAKAQNSLGEAYYEGQGVPQDYAEAARWFRMAAEQGNAEAQRSLGRAYAYAGGRGVPQDNAEAAKWYRMAAEQGNAEAQYDLSWNYTLGLAGVPQDFGKSIEWLRRAAEQGHVDAQYELGDAYDDGLMVPQNYVLAHFWFNLAASQGKRNAAIRRGMVADNMTRDQIAEAQRMALEWKPKQ